MKPTTREITIFAMLGAVMYASKLLMEVAPNIHLLGVFTIAFTVVYRKKALYPIYIYVIFKRDLLRLCGVVGSLPLCMDCSVGRCHAPSGTSSEKAPAFCIHDSLCGPWLPVWDAVCAGTGCFIWNELSGDGLLDHCGSAIRSDTWRQ